ncbi:YheC/YheD family protein [Cytobacillus depressus]|uniref:YheC/YheD family protein n=1 Tax=Cytobacillus depressus TaxID=1602942 RepID=UPI00147872EE|nr:YheC/YheD family protein [Cytobacillus depressus]
MTASNSRIVQYNILKSEESLSKHLLETELFSETTLFKFLEKYATVVIKPVFGIEEICVSFENNTFQITSKHNVTTAIVKEDLYHHLVCNEIKKKTNIIQPQKLQSPFQYYITVHRKSASTEWSFKSITKKYHSFFGKLIYLYLVQKIKKVVIRAAQKLGESNIDCNTIVFDILFQDGEVWIKDIVLHKRNSKWSQYQVFNTLFALSPYVPETELLTEFTLKKFLNKYNEVIIKPCIGRNGLGIVKVSKIDPLTYEIHSDRKKMTRSNFDEVYRYIKEKYLSQKYYLVQHKLPLAMINDCPLDVRVITQKCNSEWIVTGKLVKVAAREFFITNAVQKLLTLEEAIRDLNISHLTINEFEPKIDKICITAAKQLEVHNPEIHIIGFDIGFTHEEVIWIIEGNYKPDLSMFNMLEDKTVYKNIKKAKRK